MKRRYTYNTAALENVFVFLTIERDLETTDFKKTFHRILC